MPFRIGDTCRAWAGLRAGLRSAFHPWRMCEDSIQRLSSRSLPQEYPADADLVSVVSNVVAEASWIVDSADLKNLLKIPPVACD